MSGAPPAVSVVIATFNRSNVLVHAIDSVCAQSTSDWELIVIGDACTDDTAEVVAGYQDPRISFVNLDRNLGEQSGPNSIGLRLARGRAIAWLNHDDLWFANHLENALAALAAPGRDVVVSPWFTVGPPPDGTTWDGLPSAGLNAPSARGSFRVTDVYPASTWVVRTDTARAVGDWRSAFELRGVSSQEYLFRLWASGARFHVSRTPTVVTVPSGMFTNAYGERRRLEHDLIAPLVVGQQPDGFRRSVPATWGGYRQRLRRARQEGRLLRTLAVRAADDLLVRPSAAVAARAGFAPTQTVAWWHGRGTGAFIRALRRKRGLGETPDPPAQTR